VGEYVYARTDRLSFTDILEISSQVSAREDKNVPVPPEAFEARLSVAGEEMAM